MAFRVRSAVHEDIPAIVPWTTDTFDWGDYVPDRIADWIDDPSSEPMVCVDEADTPVAVANAVMLSESEAWLEAARVHPDHKRAGMGSAMNRAGVAWAKERGARVVRLAIMEDNPAAQRQVESLGYRLTSNWVKVAFDTTGVKPVIEPRRLQTAHSSDVDPAWMFWSNSDLAHDARSMIPLGWRWRKATPADLVEAARNKQLLQSPSGWVIATQSDDRWISVGWMATSQSETPRLLEELLAYTAERGIGELDVKTPTTPWMVESVKRAGGEPDEILIYSLAV